MARFNPFKNIGPGTLVAAAFIGPGTITLCSTAGVQFGFSLLWALLLAILAAIVLQGMAARLGLVAGKGLAEAVRFQLKTKWVRYLAVALIISAILIGNTAYQAGNIGGGAEGLGSMLSLTSIELGSTSLNYLPILLGIIAFGLLYIGSYKILETALVTLVILMSLSFIIAAIMTTPDWGAVFTGLVKPTFTENGLLVVVGLIGTTVVPYNLFLHASLVQEKWRGEKDLGKAKKDTLISIILGGLVSMAIVISAAAIPNGVITGAADLSKGLIPLYGDGAKYVLGIGLFSAGITSAITAPLAAAYVAKGCFGWQGGLKSLNFKGVWMFVLIVGTIVATIGKSPLEIIRFAQVANGLLLPIIALFLLWVVNQSEIMGKHVNSKLQNTLGGLIILITIALTLKTLYTVFFV